MSNCNCNNTTLAESNKPWEGTTLKFLLTPTATGFDAAEDDWEVEIRYGSMGKVYKTFAKSDLVESNDGYFVVIETDGMNGLVRAIVRAYVNDEDCDNGIRKEVEVVDLCYINNI